MVIMKIIVVILVVIILVMLLLKEVMDGSIDFNQEIADIFYTCTACKACTYTCPAGVEGNEIVEEVRKKLYDDGLAPDSLLGVRDSIFKQGNVLFRRQLA